MWSVVGDWVMKVPLSAMRLSALIKGLHCSCRSTLCNVHNILSKRCNIKVPSWKHGLTKSANAPDSYFPGSRIFRKYISVFYKLPNFSSSINRLRQVTVLTSHKTVKNCYKEQNWTLYIDKVISLSRRYNNYKHMYAQQTNPKNI